jgi:hypothetical protein
MEGGGGGVTRGRAVVVSDFVDDFRGKFRDFSCVHCSLPHTETLQIRALSLL